MGNFFSRDPRIMEEIKEWHISSFKKQLKAGPDIGVSGCLVKFTSLSSGEHLKLHYETRKAEASSSAADRLKELTEKLTAFAPFPEVAGLGALAIAILIDNILCPPGENLAEVIQSVFAEEKVFGVWDLIDECLKRFTMHAFSSERLREDIKRIENQLSLALTKLKNSMLRDGNMTHQALKVWVNGAAFHIHMLIHQERLGGNPACEPIKGLLSVYQKDLDQLLDKHKEMVKGKCFYYNWGYEYCGEIFTYVDFRDEDSKRHHLGDEVSGETYEEVYYEFRYGGQNTDIKRYFTELGQNLPELVQQRGSFNELVPDLYIEAASNPESTVMGNAPMTPADFKNLKGGPDLRVDRCILKFSSLSSTESLKQHYEKRRMEASDCAADWVKSLAEKLAAFSSSPELAGLGALAVAVLIDIMSFSPPEESIKEALRSVFAEEKASKVWDLIDECLKRYRMNINDQRELKKDIRRIENQMSLALTELKNSIVRDGHVTSQALKVWVNGAAFHIQMLIHLVRLEGTQNCGPIESVIQDYREDLSAVFKKHREVIREKCDAYFTTDTVGFREFHVVIESEHYTTEDRDIDKYFEVYYNERYNKQKSEIEGHFTEVERNLTELVRQTGSLTVN